MSNCTYFTFRLHGQWVLVHYILCIYSANMISGTCLLIFWLWPPSCVIKLLGHWGTYWKHCFFNCTSLKRVLINTWSSSHKTLQLFNTFLHWMSLQPYTSIVHMCTVGFALACSAELKEEVYCDWSIEKWPNKEVFSNVAQLPLHTDTTPCTIWACCSL